MAIAKQAIMQTVEIEAATDNMLISGTSGLILNYLPTRYIFANVLDLLADIQTQAPGTLDVTWDSTNSKVKFVISGQSMTSISADTNINNALGGVNFTGTATTITASNTPGGVWLPEYRSSDATWFQSENASVFVGSTGVAGKLSGINYTERKSRTVTWPSIAASNAVEYADNATDAQEDRCFEQIINGARRKVLQYEGSANLNPKGVYFIDNISNYQDDTSIMTDWDAGVPNKTDYLYCSPGTPDVGGRSDSLLNVRYDLSCKLTSTTVQDWSASGYAHE